MTAVVNGSANTQEHNPLLPKRFQRQKSRWAPVKHLEPSRAPPLDESGSLELFALRDAHAEGQAVARPKRTTERRTVDFNGSLARWRIERMFRPTIANDTPFLRPSINHIVELLPASAYTDNLAVSICGKFVHTSRNKDRTPINAITWTPEGRRVLTASRSGEFTLWNGLSWNWESILQAHDSPIRTVAYTKSGNWVISSDSSGYIKYFTPNMNHVFSMQGHQEAICGLAMSPDDRKFATGSDDRTIKIWNFGDETPVRNMTGHDFDVKCVDWHPYQSLIVSGSKDHSVAFWDPRTSSILRTLSHHRDGIYDCKFSLDGNLCATSSRDRDIRLFDLRNLKELRILKGHKEAAVTLAWHPLHHNLLASGGHDKAIFYWTTEDSTPLDCIEYAHDAPITSLAWQPIGNLLASGSLDHNTRFWCRERPGVQVGMDRYHLGALKAAELGIKEEAEEENVHQRTLVVPGLDSNANNLRARQRPQNGPPFGSVPSFGNRNHETQNTRHNFSAQQNTYQNFSAQRGADTNHRQW